MYFTTTLPQMLFHHNYVLHTPKPATKMYFLSVQCLFPPILRRSILTLPRPCRPGETRLHTKDVGFPPPARERGAHLEKPPRGLGLVDSDPQILNPAVPPSFQKMRRFQEQECARGFARRVVDVVVQCKERQCKVQCKERRKYNSACRLCDT